jgi:hypothetical protein
MNIPSPDGSVDPQEAEARIIYGALMDQPDDIALENFSKITQLHQWLIQRFMKRTLELAGPVIAENRLTDPDIPAIPTIVSDYLLKASRPYHVLIGSTVPARLPKTEAQLARWLGEEPAKQLLSEVNDMVMREARKLGMSTHDQLKSEIDKARIDARTILSPSHVDA